MAISTTSSELPTDIAQDAAFVQEQYPRIGEKILQLWGSSELNEYLDSILFDERGSRHGFPLTIVSALMHIHENHASLVPPKITGDYWDTVLKEVEK
jgi:hypothetical protein